MTSRILDVVMNEAGIRADDGIAAFDNLVTVSELLLEIDIAPLAAWMSLLEPEIQSRILAGLPRRGAGRHARQRPRADG